MCFSKCPDCKLLKKHKLNPFDLDLWYELFGEEPPSIQCELCKSRLRAQVQDEKDRERGIL